MNETSQDQEANFAPFEASLGAQTVLCIQLNKTLTNSSNTSILKHYRGIASDNDGHYLLHTFSLPTPHPLLLDKMISGVNAMADTNIFYMSKLLSALFLWYFLFKKKSILGSF